MIQAKKHLVAVVFATFKIGRVAVDTQYEENSTRTTKLADIYVLFVCMNHSLCIARCTENNSSTLSYY